MSDLSEKVPEAAVVQAFSGIMAISPELYGRTLEALARQHGVPCDTTFGEYVAEVLRRQPQIDWD